MGSPFPGMVPYLEGWWEDTHQRLCTYAADALQPQLLPHLVARLDERTVIESASDPDRSVYPAVKVTEARGGTAVLASPMVCLAEPLLIRFGSEPRTESFITILDPRNGNAIVTVIEFLSGSN